MRTVLTRVKHASVSVDGKVIGQIGEGFLVLLGVTHEDTEAQAEKLADKLTGLRIFEDENEKMNRSLTDVGGSLLIVSQFTLYANCKKGRRPDFLAAARPEVAIPRTRSSCSCAATRASTPRPASSAPICRWTALTTDP